jgi:hypothetical protein
MSLTQFEKYKKWQNAYKKINKQIREKNLLGVDAAIFYQQRVKDYKEIIK